MQSGLNTEAEVHPHPHRWGALTVLLIGAFLPPLDYFVVNIALPSIRQGLRASDGSLQFVLSAYAGAYAVLLVLGGRLGDLYGRRRMFITGMVGFALASGLCGMAWSPATLVFGRILQGATAAILAPQVVASIHVLFPHHERIRAMGLYGATFGLAGIVGQLLSGALIGANLFGLGWRAIFLINLPITMCALIAAIPLLYESRAKEERDQTLDIAGTVLLLLALAALVCPLIEGRQQGWPAWSLVCMGACPVLMYFFWQTEKRIAAENGHPLVHPVLFRAPGFSLGLCVTLLYYTIGAFFLAFAIYLQAGLHYPPLRAGFGFLPLGLGFFIGPLTTPRITRLLGYRVTSLGLAITCSGLLMLAVAVNSTGTLRALLFIPGLFVVGFGQGVVLPTLVRTVIHGVSASYAGAASGVAVSTLQISSALGVAIVGGIFFGILKGQVDDTAAVTRAFTVATLSVAALLLCAALLALALDPNIRTFLRLPERAFSD